jgi:hypothetical protein
MPHFRKDVNSFGIIIFYGMIRSGYGKNIAFKALGGRNGAAVCVGKGIK